MESVPILSKQKPQTDATNDTQHVCLHNMHINSQRVHQVYPQLGHKLAALASWKAMEEEREGQESWQDRKK